MSLLIPCNQVDAEQSNSISIISHSGSSDSNDSFENVASKQEASKQTSHVTKSSHNNILYHAKGAFTYYVICRGGMGFPKDDAGWRGGGGGFMARWRHPKSLNFGIFYILKSYLNQTITQLFIVNSLYFSEITAFQVIRATEPINILVLQSKACYLQVACYNKQLYQIWYCWCRLSGASTCMLGVT